MRSLESPIIDLISTFLAKHDKSEKVVRFKCGHVKGDPNHIEAQNRCGGDMPQNTNLGTLPDPGSAFAVGTKPSTTEIARPTDGSTGFNYDSAVSEVRGRSWGMGDED